MASRPPISNHHLPDSEVTSHHTTIWIWIWSIWGVLMDFTSPVSEFGGEHHVQQWVPHNLHFFGIEASLLPDYRGTQAVRKCSTQKHTKSTHMYIQNANTLTHTETHTHTLPDYRGTQVVRKSRKCSVSGAHQFCVTQVCRVSETMQIMWQQKYIGIWESYVWTPLNVEQNFHL